MTSIAARLRGTLVLGLLFLAFLGGCASTNNPRDPLETFNRAVYTVNDGLDRVIVKPLVTGYRAVLPQFVRTGVTNFFNNLHDILTALNNLLQGKFIDAASDLGRIGVNTMVGLLGVIDVGTELGLEKHHEDFGQTLGRWGIGSGPYLQLPFFGPSSFRDAAGLAVDSCLDPIKWIFRNDIPWRNGLWGLYFVNLRANLLDSTKILDEAALDPYEFQRDAYLQRRRNLVYDGNPPPEPDEPPEIKTKPRSELDDPAPRSELEESQATASIEAAAPAPVRAASPPVSTAAVLPPPAAATPASAAPVQLARPFRVREF
jgi:phospholipid-binding lipoprotein MlaA